MLKNSLLWKIASDPSFKNPSFIFGTMHVKDKAAFAHVESILNYLHQCESYYGEMDLKASQTDIDISEYMLPNGRSLKSYMLESQYRKMRKIILKAFHLDIDNLQFFKPLIIMTKLSEAVLNDDNSRPLDYDLWQKAQHLNMSMHGLESVSEQVDTMRSLEIELQVKMLRKSVSKINALRKSTLQLTEYYQKQEIQKLYKASKKSLGKFRHILLYDRNRVMASRIEANIKVPSFYAIGAAHLAGKKGVLKFLKHNNIFVRGMDI